MDLKQENNVFSKPNQAKRSKKNSIYSYRILQNRHHVGRFASVDYRPYVQAPTKLATSAKRLRNSEEEISGTVHRSSLPEINSASRTIRTVSDEAEGFYQTTKSPVVESTSNVEEKPLPSFPMEDEMDDSIETVSESESKKGMGGFIHELLHPVDKLNEFEERDYDGDDVVGAFKKLCIKYLMIGISFVFGLSTLLNQDPFSFSRVTFSLGVTTVVQIFLLGTLFELLTYYILALFQAKDFRNYVVVQSKTAYAIGAIFLLVNLILAKSAFIWMICAVIAIAVATILHHIAYRNLSSIDDKKALKLSAFGLILMLFWLCSSAGILGEDILRGITGFLSITLF